MRIHELAKNIGQRFSTDIKSADLIEEIRGNSAFTEIRDKIKSHSSSIDDKHAKIMYEIYEKKTGAAGAAGEPAPAQTATPETPRPVAPKPQPPRPKPQAVVPRPTPLGQAARPAPPRVAPIRPAGTPPRPAPISAAPTTPPLTAKQAPATPPKPKPEAVAPQAAHREEAKPVEKAQKPAASVPPKPVEPAAQPKQEAEPQKKHSRKEKGRRDESARLGQPAAPKMPKFSMNSAFLKPQQPPETPSRKGNDDSRGRKEDDANNRPRKPVQLDDVGQIEIGVMNFKGKRGGRPAGDKIDKDKRLKGEKLAKSKRKTVRPTKVYGDADEFRPPSKLKKRPQPQNEKQREEEATPVVIGPVTLTEPLTVAEFAAKIGTTTAELIKAAFMKGKAITVNQLIDFDLAEELAFDHEIDLRIELAGDETDVAEFRDEDTEEQLQGRPPVVTIMGHVDHGKTTVLDYYRSSNVAEGEHGGITQHIGAYHVTSSRGDIVFLDTPGHAAFTAMRARGASVTDIVVIVVAADDGVMPQTIEAINHAKAAKVPLIVAINKIDLPDSNPDRVRNELMQYEVISTQLGGETEFVEVSAKQGQNMDELLEIISLQAEVMELKANPERRAEGVIIESHIDKLRGAVATILVQRGTLHNGDIFVVGQETGRVRAMRDDHGKLVDECLPAHPVEVIGLSGTPEVGELFLVMENERKARAIADIRESRRRLVDLGTTRHVTIEGLQDVVDAGERRLFNVILKADVQGSVEAIIQSLSRLDTTEVGIRVLHSGTGGITESDIDLAMASDAIVLGFNVRPESGVTEKAERENVEIRLHSIIYELLEEMEATLMGMHEKRFKEVSLSRVEVREIFKVSRIGNIAGCMVLSGEINRNDKVRLIRDNVPVFEGKIASLRRVKDDVQKVAQGFECGIMLERFSDIKRGDIIESFTQEEIPVEVTRLEDVKKS